jgi:TonB family protein
MWQETLKAGGGLPPATPERRCFPRKNLIGFTPVSLENSAPGAVSITNISKGGMSIHSDSYLHFPPSGKFSFVLPESSQQIEVVAQLAWVDRNGSAGLRFLEMPEASAEGLDAWLGWTNDSAPSDLSSEEKAVSEPQDVLTDLKEQIASAKGTHSALSLIAEDILNLTRASGAAIALATPEGFVCSANAGQAPAPGTVVNPASGLSGECIRTGAIIRCDDAYSDKRVEPAVCLTLGFRSAVILPIRSGDETVGIIQVLSPEANHFDNGDVFALTSAAELVLEVVPQLTRNNSSPEPPSVEVSSQALIDQESAQLLSPIDSDPEALETHPETEPMVSPGPDDHDFVQLAPPEEPTVDQFAVPVDPERLEPPEGKTQPLTEGRLICDSCGFANPAGTEECRACDIPLGTQERRPVVLLSRFRDPRWSEEERARGRRASPVVTRTLLLFFGAMALLLAHQVWKDLRSTGKPPASAPPAEKKGAQNSPITSSAAVPAETKAQDGTQTDSNAIKAQPVTMPFGSLKTGPHGSQVASYKPELQKKPKPSPSHPAGARTTVSQGKGAVQMTGGDPVYQPQPPYPEYAKRSALSGAVELKFLVNTKGAVENIQLVRGDTRLAQAAIATVKQWKYRPFEVSGQPVTTESRAILYFTPPR